MPTPPDPTAPPPGALPRPPRLAPDRVLAGRYRVVRFIASGGMGEVYEAEDLDLRERVALKLIRPDLAANPRAGERFRREVSLARRVTHPSACRLFDFGKAEEAGEELLYLTMELLPGETLHERLRHGRLAEDEALPIARQVASALQAAHDAGVVHRDFKSGNILLVPAGGGPPRAVVTDFGLARSFDATISPSATTLSAISGHVVGTPDYLAPEQIEGHDATPASDIYALGVVLFEMVTGSRPFEGPTVLAVVAKRLSEAAPSPRERRADLAVAWEDTILRCLERDPRQRFVRVSDVVAGLEGRPVEPPLRTQPVRRARAGRRVALLALLGLPLVAAALWLRPGRPRPRLGSPTQLTSSTGLDLHPAFSPDGAWIAYSSDRSGRFEIYVRPTSGSGPEVAVTSDGQQNVQPTWSPHGQALAYHSLGRGGIWQVPAGGGTPRRMASFGSHPAWSPTGALVAFQSEPLVDVAPNAVAALPPSTLWVVPSAGGEPRAVTRAGSPPGGHGAPAWSPDEKRLAFTSSERHAAALWMVALDGAELVRLDDRLLYAYDPVFTPDGRRVLYAALSESGHDALLALSLEADGRVAGPPERLADLGPVAARHLSVSRDGRVAYSSLSLVSNLWAVKGEGEPRRLTSETGRSARPVHSPDGQWIAFERFRPGLNPDLWVMRADGTQARQLTRDPAVDTVASWRPDGGAVAFRSDRDGRRAVWLHELRSGRESLLADLGMDMDWPKLSPDGNTLAFNSTEGGGTINVWLAKLPAGKPRQVTFDGQLAGFPCWTPDGSSLAIEVRRGDDLHVALVGAGGGPPRLLTRNRGQSWPGSFSPDGSRIAFAGLRDGVWNVFSIPSRGGEERRLTAYTTLNGYVRYPSWGPRDEIVFERAETTGNVWTIDGLP